MTLTSSLRCAPIGPLVNGRFALQTIDGQPLPAMDGDPNPTTLYYDTLAFAFPEHGKHLQPG